MSKQAGEAAQEAATYDAFLSYSRVDREFASMLQIALERAYHRLPPRYRRGRGPLRVLRDETDFDLSSDIEGYIHTLVRQSASLVVLATPASHESHWVNNIEIPTFLERDGGHDRIVVVVREFVGEGPMRDSFPARLVDESREPLAVDFRPERWNEREHRERALTQILARILGEHAADLLERHARYRRQVRRIRWLVVLFAGVITTGLVWFGLDRYRANRSAELAQRSAELLHERPLQAWTLATEAWDVAPGPRSYAVLFRAAHNYPHEAVPELVLDEPIVTMVFGEEHLLVARGTGALVLDRDLRTVVELDHGDDVFTSVISAVEIQGGEWITGTSDGWLTRWSPSAEPLEQHKSEYAIEHISVDAARTRIAVAYASEVASWRPGDQRGLVTLAHTDAVVALRFLASSVQLTTVDRGGALRLWSEGGEVLRQAQTAGPVLRASISASGRTTTLTMSGMVETWNPALEKVGEFSIGVTTAPDIMLAPDGNLVFIGREKWPFLLSGVDGRPRTLQGVDSLYVQAFSPDGDWMLASNAVERPFLWSESVPMGISLAKHRGIVSAAVFSNDGALLVTGSEDGEVRAWDMGPLRRQRIRLDELFIRAIRCSEGCACTIWGYGDRVFAWEPSAGFEMVEPRPPPEKGGDEIRDASARATCAPGSSKVDVFWVGDLGLVELGNERYLFRQKDESCRPLPLAATVTAATVADFGMWVGDSDGKLHLIDVDGELLLSMSAHDEAVTALATNACGLLSGGEDGVVVVWPTDPSELRFER